MTVAARLAEDLCAAGWVVVSGAAYGIDSAGHRGALQSGGCTIAVVAGGLGHHLDAPGADLLRRIRAQGLVVSEADHAASPRKHSFLHRNRLIAALTRATVVVEAAQRSGALNTARRADSLGRVVAAVPGPVTGGASTGTHALIRDGRAVLVRGISDVLELIEPLGTVPPPASRP
jgi:DNA processing protein